jgi:hypothetical protein
LERTSECGEKLETNSTILIGYCLLAIGSIHSRGAKFGTLVCYLLKDDLVKGYIVYEKRLGDKSRN